MTRLFPQHDIRFVESLDGLWHYYFPREGTEIAPESWREGREVRLPVPSVWETLREYVNYRGQAVACRVFSTEKSGPARLVFGGISHTARVFVDGKEVGFHHNAFTAFTIDLPHIDAGEHELLVHISNEHGEISGLHVPNDYYNYGGISRPVELHRPQTPLLIDRVHATPVRKDDGSWSLKLEAKLINLTEGERSADLELFAAGASVTLRGCTAGPGETLVETSLDCPEAKSWTPANPRLYFLHARLTSSEGVLDDKRERIGFRTVKVDGRKVLLNGKPTYFVGFNRHEDHPDYGCAIPVDIMLRDLNQMRALNANMVRTSHYPNDPRFLDLCDEMGFMVWEENHARGITEKTFPKDQGFNHPRFRQQLFDVTKEMVEQHFNHASIVIWGVLNECETWTDIGRDIHAENIEWLKRADPSRPTTYAACHPPLDRCQGLPDICSWNTYPNWYGQDRPADNLKWLKEHYRKGGWGQQPVIMSEFGGGAIYGFRDPVRRGKWSEDRQGEIIGECLDTYWADEDICGTLIWQFCDVRVDESWAIQRPRTMNNKGIVDEHRRPKLAFDDVSRRFAEKLKGLEYAE